MVWDMGACMLTDSGIAGTEWHGLWAPAYYLIAKSIHVRLDVQ